MYRESQFTKCLVAEKHLVIKKKKKKIVATTGLQNSSTTRRAEKKREEIPRLFAVSKPFVSKLSSYIEYTLKSMYIYINTVKFFSGARKYKMYK